ncbi:MAG: prepilin-type N-terminal cleavage/methylation domain-containing protein [Deltaproteobacteria bacterium]|nr:prepilin-type N-terminal cleavage/methylation domain-containing protein [Deltaproteobacteria bacterium]
MLLRIPKGFSLVELMVVVAIISVLAAIAIPRFQTFQAKARQAEAKMNLSHIFTLEESYQAENDQYTNLAEDAACGDSNELGFYISNCAKARYHYSVTDASTVAFSGHAKSGEGPANKVTPGCQMDYWTIDQDKVLRAVSDSVTRCGQAGGRAPAPAE